MKCLHCNNDTTTNNDYGRYKSYFCNNCQLILMYNSETNNFIYSESVVSEYRKPRVNIPELCFGSKVYINNVQHQMFLEQGIVENKSHDYYRLKLISCDKKWNGTKIWVPFHWVTELPDELKC